MSPAAVSITGNDQVASIELSAPRGTVLRIDPYSRQSDFLCELAQRCFFTGTFPTADGGQNRWILDCRHGLAHGAAAQRIACELVERARGVGTLQFAGIGVGAQFLLGAILGVERQARVGLIRTERKPFGRRNLIEGALDPNQPVCLVDDVLNSGKTACHAVNLMRQERFEVSHCLCIFQYAWGRGVDLLAQSRVGCSSLATVSQIRGEATATSVSSINQRSWFSRLWSR